MAPVRRAGKGRASSPRFCVAATCFEKVQLPWCKVNLENVLRMWRIIMYLLKKGRRQAGKKSPASQDTLKYTWRQGAEEVGFLYKRGYCQARNAGTEPRVFYVVEEG